MKPRLNGHTWPLWLLTPLALGGGGLALWIYGRRREKSGAKGDAALLALTADEEARVNRLIGAEPGSEN